MPYFSPRRPATYQPIYSTSCLNEELYRKDGVLYKNLSDKQKEIIDDVIEVYHRRDSDEITTSTYELSAMIDESNIKDIYHFNPEHFKYYIKHYASYFYHNTLDFIKERYPNIDFSGGALICDDVIDEDDYAHSVSRLKGYVMRFNGVRIYQVVIPNRSERPDSEVVPSNQNSPEYMRMVYRFSADFSTIYIDSRQSYIRSKMKHQIFWRKPFCNGFAFNLPDDDVLARFEKRSNSIAERLDTPFDWYGDNYNVSWLLDEGVMAFTSTPENAKMVLNIGDLMYIDEDNCTLSKVR